MIESQIIMEQRHIAEHIERLLAFGLKKKLLDNYDLEYTRNQLLALFKIEEPYADKTLLKILDVESVDDTMEILLEYGYKIGLIEHNGITYRDLLDAKIMGILIGRPSQFISQFNSLKAYYGIEKATRYFYELSIHSRYIRMDRIKQNPTWIYHSNYGPLQMSINLSKPEKDPLEIAKLKALPQAHYPLCLLCKDNVGYQGRLNHPARQNLRVLPLQLQEEEWFLQYSPYVYYNEHSIVLNGTHTDMNISRNTFARLLDFVDQFPHYFVGSNADLPIVGGSILNHDHYQAGRHHFPMIDAESTVTFKSSTNNHVQLSIVKWPLSVIRLTSKSKQSILEVAETILQAWRSYSDVDYEIEAYTYKDNGEAIPHNTITPIARKREDKCYELDLVLRNNRTSEQHPFGIFHPHEHLHHIKKENIGLIEVMGLAVLPARLKQELTSIVKLLVTQDEQIVLETLQEGHHLFEHKHWIAQLLATYSKVETEQEAWTILHTEVGKKFLEVLEDAGVFKQDKEGIAGFTRFINKVGFK